MNETGFEQNMARILEVAPNEMTFEDGMRTLEFLTSFSEMFRQAESERLTPDPTKLAQFDFEAERLLNLRSELIELWRGMVREYQPTLREYYALISADASKPQ